MSLYINIPQPMGSLPWNTSLTNALPTPYHPLNSLSNLPSSSSPTTVSPSILGITSRYREPPWAQSNPYLCKPVRGFPWTGFPLLRFQETQTLVAFYQWKFFPLVWWFQLTHLLSPTIAIFTNTQLRSHLLIILKDPLPPATVSPTRHVPSVFHSIIH